MRILKSFTEWPKEYAGRFVYSKPRIAEQHRKIV